MTTSPASNSRLPALDLLRFTAALAVTLYHYASSFPTGAETESTLIEPLSAITRYGYLGVDLFFMISGFVILWSSQNRTALGFATSRAGRLYPSFWVAMLLSAAFIVVASDTAMQLNSPTIDAKTVLGNATMLPAMLGVPMIDGVYWTLEMEIRFYGLIFLLLLLRQMPKIELWLYVWLTASIACLFVEMPWLIEFGAIYPYGPMFITGCFFYLLYSQGPSVTRLTGLFLAAGLSLYLSIGQRAGFITPDHISAVVVPLVMLVFFLLFGLIALRKRTTPPGNLTTRLGALTYPLYLIHGTIGHIVFHMLPNSLALEFRLLAITALALALAYILSITAETYGRRAFERGLSNLLQFARLQPGKAA